MIVILASYWLWGLCDCKTGLLLAVGGHLIVKQACYWLYGADL